MYSRTWVISHWDCRPWVHMKQCPQETLNGITTRSPALMWVTAEPTSSTMPIGSWPMMSPLSMNGVSTSYRCRSEPQIADEVIRTIASVGSWITGSGTSSTLTVRFACQVKAFMRPPLPGPPPRPEGQPADLIGPNDPTHAISGAGACSPPENDETHIKSPRSRGRASHGFPREIFRGFGGTATMGYG